MKALIGAHKQEKALVGALFVIDYEPLCGPSFQALASIHHCSAADPCSEPAADIMPTGD